jgi:hypothetical protein
MSCYSNDTTLSKYEITDYVLHLKQYICSDTSNVSTAVTFGFIGELNSENKEWLASFHDWLTEMFADYMPGFEVSFTSVVNAEDADGAEVSIRIVRTCVDPTRRDNNPQGLCAELDDFIAEDFRFN